MKKRYMPKDVFEVGVSTVAKIHLHTGKDIEELAKTVWHGYEGDIIDDGVLKDIERASTDALAWLRQQDAPDIAEFFHHFSYFCMNYDDSGNPKKKKLFSGLWFQKTEPDTSRVERYLNKLKSYYVGVSAGIMPVAPRGWSLSNT